MQQTLVERAMTVMPARVGGIRAAQWLLTAGYTYYAYWQSIR